MRLVYCINIATLLAASFFVAEISCGETIKLTTGKTITVNRVLRSEPDGIVYITPGGVSKIPFNELPSDIRDEYRYNPQRAAEYEREVHRREIEYRQSVRAAHATDIKEREKGLRNKSNPQTILVKRELGIVRRNHIPQQKNSQLRFNSPSVNGFEYNGFAAVPNSHNHVFQDGFTANSQSLNRNASAMHINAMSSHIDSLQHVDRVAAGHMSLGLSSQAHGAGLHDSGHQLNSIGSRLLSEPGYNATHDIMTLPSGIHSPMFP